MDAPAQMLSLDAVAEVLGVSKTSVEEWVRTKAIASFKKGRVRRIAREDLARFVALNTVKPRRPDWLTASVESEFRRQLRELVETLFTAEAQRRREAA